MERFFQRALLAGSIILSLIAVLNGTPTTASGEDVIQKILQAESLKRHGSFVVEVKTNLPGFQASTELDVFYNNEGSLYVAVRTADAPELRGLLLATLSDVAAVTRGDGSTQRYKLAERPDSELLALQHVVSGLQDGQGFLTLIDTSHAKILQAQGNAPQPFYVLEAPIKAELASALGIPALPIRSEVSDQTWLPLKVSLALPAPWHLTAAIIPAPAAAETAPRWLNALRGDGRLSEDPIDDNDFEWLELKSGRLHSRGAGGALGSVLAAAEYPASNLYWLVQLREPASDDLRSELAAAGAQIQSFIPRNAYLIRANAEAIAEMRGLPFVGWVIPFKPEFKIDPGLSGSDQEITISLQTFAAADQQLVQTAIEALGATVEEASFNEWQGVFKVRIAAHLAPSLAEISGVHWVEPYSVPKTMNERARYITAAGAAWGNGLRGQGQVVAVADTGLDGGANNVSADFLGRVRSTFGLGRSTWEDRNGHGTHVAGSVLGNGALSSGQHAGMAPDAHLVVQGFNADCDGNLLGGPADLNALFKQAYDAGARIHSNSWGVPGNTYSSASQQVDQFMWTHRDFLILFAAGNSGVDGTDGVVDAGSLSTHATNKSGITVGASESDRRGEGFNGTYNDLQRRAGNTRWGVAPIPGDHISNNPLGMAAFSSRGPTADSRIKPEIVAPGTNILSARTHARNVCGAPDWPAGPHYQYQMGTSMATPLVAGASALVRQGLERKGISPSAALIKAVLIAGADDLAPGQYGAVGPGQPVFLDTFEDGGSRWRPDGPWGLTAEARNGRWAIGYSSTVPATFTTHAAIPLAGISNPVVRFSHRYNLAAGVAGTPPSVCFPINIIAGALHHLSSAAGNRTAAITVHARARVEVSRDGRSWATVASYQDRSGWAEEAVSLAGYAGGSVYLRLRIEPVDRTRGAEWFLDDIAVSGGSTREMESVPDRSQGWGRLNVERSTGDGFGLLYQNPSGLGTDAQETHLVSTSAGQAVRAVLAWSDYPADLASAVSLVNDLDLRVEAPNGTVLHPNKLSAPDKRNTLERVDFQAAGGQYKIIVTGARVPIGPQPYALAVSGGTSVPLPTTIPVGPAPGPAPTPPERIKYIGGEGATVYNDFRFSVQQSGVAPIEGWLVHASKPAGAIGRLESAKLNSLETDGEAASLWGTGIWRGSLVTFNLYIRRSWYAMTLYDSGGGEMAWERAPLIGGGIRINKSP